jgi:hypothetical protein
VRWVHEKLGGGWGLSFLVDNKGKGFYEQLCMQTDMTAYDCAVPYPEVPQYSQFCYNASFHNALLLLGEIFCKIRKITVSNKIAFFFFMNSFS